MSFVGITFDGQNVSPKDDGALYQAHNGDGILDGCSMTISGDDLVIQSGHIIAGGRVCKVDGATNVDLSGRQLSTGYIQVILNYDLTQSEGNQWYESFVESATTTFPALTQDDINGTGTLYQLEIAVVQISGGNLTSIYSEMQYSPAVAYNNARIYDAVGDNSNLWFENNGTAKGVVWYSDVNQSLNFTTWDSGTTKAGLRCPFNGTGDVILYNTSGNVALRPNGSSVGQFYIDTSGYPNGTKWSFGSITAVYGTQTDRGYWVQVGRMCAFQIYCNIGSYTANTWTNLSHSSTPLPLPAGQEPRFVCVSDGGGVANITHTGEAKVTTGGIIQVAFPSAYSGVRAITVNGVYRCT